MKNDWKSNIQQSIFTRLFNFARSNQLDFNYLLIRYGVERFLFRLSVSVYSEFFVLKGSNLFIIWKGQNYRLTRDVDLLSFNTVTIEDLKKIFTEICLIQVEEEDGILFAPESLKLETIREHQNTGGIRVTLIGYINKARIPLQVDVGFGDEINPDPEMVDFPVLLDSSIPRLKAYTRYTVVAEKFHAIVNLGLANSRMKDFYDIWLLSRLFHYDAKILADSIWSTFSRRGTPLPTSLPFAFTKEFYENRQKILQWKSFLQKTKPLESIEDLSGLILTISDFILPILQTLM
jgi:hypothetical protein